MYYWYGLSRRDEESLPSGFQIQTKPWLAYSSHYLSESMDYIYPHWSLPTFIFMIPCMSPVFYSLFCLGMVTVWLSLISPSLTSHLLLKQQIVSFRCLILLPRRGLVILGICTQLLLPIICTSLSKFFHGY